MKLVIGGGVSGIGACKLLVKTGHKVRLSDQGSLKEQDQRLLSDLGVEVFDKGHAESHLENIEEIIVSPGLPPDHKLIQMAKHQQIPIISEIDLIH